MCAGRFRGCAPLAFAIVSFFELLAQPPGELTFDELKAFSVARRRLGHVRFACADNGGDLAPVEATPHDLRHTFAHRYLEEHPGDLVGLARILGHESLDTTKIYTRPTVEQLARRIGQLPLNAYG